MPVSIKMFAPLTKWSFGYEISVHEPSRWGQDPKVEQIIVGQVNELDSKLHLFFEQNRALPMDAVKSKFLGPESPIFKKVRLNNDVVRAIIRLESDSDVLEFVSRYGSPGPAHSYLQPCAIREIAGINDALHVPIPFVFVNEVLDLARFVETVLDFKFNSSKIVAGDGQIRSSMRRIRSYGNRHGLPQNPHLAEICDISSVSSWLEESKIMIDSRLSRLCRVQGTFDLATPEMRPCNLEGLILLNLRNCILGHSKARRRCLQCGSYFEISHAALKFCPDNRSCKNTYNKSRARKNSI